MAQVKTQIQTVTRAAWTLLGTTTTNEFISAQPTNGAIYVRAEEPTDAPAPTDDGGFLVPSMQSIETALALPGKTGIGVYARAQGSRDVAVVVMDTSKTA